MTAQAKGQFEVKIIPQKEDREIALMGRMTIDKVFHGDLEGSSQGQMLSSGTAIPNSAGYVAIEKVEGTLQGKRGTFVLQHHATMNKGEAMLEIIVIPDSGTDQLLGLSGKLNIIRKEGKHFYEFEYTLPD
ncbi:MAG: DUF3224 domain-containing protein [Chitinophagaceae bacterium]|nr:DUF3224 domain-containing protein [Chitinophagaceae bacterium]